MKAEFRTVTLLVCLLASVAIIRAQSVQDLGFPNPAAVEIVFPQIAFGKSQAGKLVSEIIVANSSERDALVETDLFNSEGHAPSLRFENVSAFSGHFTAVVASHSIAVLRYPLRYFGELVGPPFNGWVVFRSNGNVTAFQRIKVLDPETNELVSETDLPGNPRPTLGAEFRVFLKSFADTGFAIVNPSGSRPLHMSIQLLNANREILQEKIIDLPPRAQKAIVAGNFFEPTDFGRAVRLKPQNAGDVFAYTVLDFALFEASSTHRGLLGLSVPERIDRITTEKFFFEQAANFLWNFPDSVTATARVGDLQILLTSLGLFLRTDDGARLGPFRVLETAPKIQVSEAMGIAVAAGRSQNLPFEKPIIFAKQRRVLWRR